MLVVALLYPAQVVTTDRPGLPQKLPEVRVELLDARPLRAGDDAKDGWGELAVTSRMFLSQVLPELLGSDGLRELLFREKQKPGERFLRAEIPAEAIERFRRGELDFVWAKDGSGLLPTLVDRKRSWKKQVRLRWDREKIPEPEVRRIDAAQHAATQAALAEILKKLDEIQDQLEGVLENQRIGWHSEIEGAERHLRIASHPSDRAIARANLWKGTTEGLMQIERRVAKLPEPLSGWREFVPSYSVTPRKIAKSLDELQTDVLWVLRGVAALHEATEEGRRAELVQDVDAVMARLAPAIANCRRLAVQSEKRSSRMEFWERSALDRPALSRPALALNMPLSELEAILKEQDCVTT